MAMALSTEHSPEGSTTEEQLEAAAEIAEKLVPAKALADMLQPIVLKAITDAWDDVSLAHVILALNMLKERYTLIHASRSACHSPGRLSPASQFFYYSEPLNRK